MEEMIELIRKYNLRYKINITICLEYDGSGICVNNPYKDSNDWIVYFEFNSIKELKQKLQQ